MRTTWKPHEKHGQLTTQSDLPDSVYAFPKQRKEPLTDARHVRNASARFDQVEGVSDADRDLAFANLKKAAEHMACNCPRPRGGNSALTGKPKAKKKADAAPSPRRGKGALDPRSWT